MLVHGAVGAAEEGGGDWDAGGGSQFPGAAEDGEASGDTGDVAPGAEDGAEKAGADAIPAPGVTAVPAALDSGIALGK